MEIAPEKREEVIEDLFEGMGAVVDNGRRVLSGRRSWPGMEWSNVNRESAKRWRIGFMNGGWRDAGVCSFSGFSRGMASQRSAIGYSIAHCTT